MFSIITDLLTTINIPALKGEIGRKRIAKTLLLIQCLGLKTHDPLDLVWRDKGEETVLGDVLSFRQIK